MRKGLTTLMVILLAVGAMLVSCKAEVGTPADELVAVSFEMNDSRSLTATLESFAPGSYYWKYAAKKDAADTSGLTSGATSSYDETGAVFIHEATPGLTGKVPGFSQGLWDFLLFGYKKIEGDNPSTTDVESYYYVLIYSGEAKAVTLQTKGDNTAHVVVNPVAEGDGYIKIGTITFIPKKSGDETGQLKFIEVTNPDGSPVSEISYDTTTQTYTVPAGAYKVTVKFANAAQTIVYGEGYVIATVYPNLTTTIAGELSELVTYAQFDAELNPDAVNVQAESVAVTTESIPTAGVSVATVSTAPKQVSTTVAKDDVLSIIDSMAEDQGVSTDPSTTSLKLALNVDPTEATATTVTYEIGMTATLTYQESSTGPKQVSSKAVKELEKYVIVEIEMSKGLSSVTVTHSDVAMVKCDSLEELTNSSSTEPTHPGFYFYDAAGTLYIKTRTFSPFAISYIAPANYVAKLDGVKYVTLADAIAALPTGNKEPKTITLLCDVTNAEGVSVGSGKNFIVDFAGHTYTVNKPGAGSSGTETQAFQLLKDSTIVFKNGTINLSADNLTPATEPKKNILRIIQNYADLTLEDMTIDGTNQYEYNDYIVSFNNGSSKITGNTSFIMPSSAKADDVVFDVYVNSSYTSTALEINTKGTIPGVVEVARGAGTAEKPVSLSIKGGTFSGSLSVSNTCSALVSGGKFADKNVCNYLVLGYTAKENEYGYWQVEEASLTLVEAVDSTCFATGTHTHWLDEDGHKLIVDGDKIWLATDEDLIIPAHNHALVYESYTDNGDGTCTVNLSCLKCPYLISKTDVKLYVLSNPSTSTTHTTFTVTCGNTVTENVPFYNCLKMGGVIVLPTDDSDATYYINNNNDNINIDTDNKTFHDLYVVGCGQKISVVGTSMENKGLRVMNRDADMVQNGTFTNVYFANVTLGAWSTDAKNPNYPLFITSYNVEVGFTNVTFGGAEGKQSINVWGQQTLNKKLDGSDYPTKKYNAAVYMNFKDCAVENNYSFMFALQGMEAKKNYYTSIHMCADSSSIEALALDGAGVSVNTEVYHDGIHNEWFLNGKILRGISGSKGIYSEVLAIVE